MPHRGTPFTTLHIIVALSLILLSLVHAVPASGDSRGVSAVIGNGTPASCTPVATIAGIASGGQITFNCGSAPHTIVISSTLSLPNNSVLDGGSLITLDGDLVADPLLRVSNTVSATVKNITVTRAVIGIFDAGALSATQIRVQNNSRNGISVGSFISINPVKLTLSSSTVSNNGSDALTANAGIYAPYASTLDLIDSEISENYGVDAGGIHAATNVNVFLVNSIIRNNRASINAAAAGIRADSELQIANSAVFSNTGGRVGGLRYGSNAHGVITNTTFSSNRGSDTGAIEVIRGFLVDGGLSLTHVTLNDNQVFTPTAGTLASIRVAAPAQVSPTLALTNTVIANPITQTSCTGTLISYGGNFAVDDSCALTQARDLTGTNPLLGPLTTFVGGPPGHAPTQFSPLIDAAQTAGCTPVDQRGNVRPQGLGCDIGAIEFNQAPGMLEIQQYSIPSGGPLRPGQLLTRSIVVSNTGMGPGLNLSVTLDIAGSVNNATLINPAATFSTTGQILWVSTSIAAGSVQTFFVQLRAPDTLARGMFTHTIQGSIDKQPPIVLPALVYQVEPARVFVPVVGKR